MQGGLCRPGPGSRGILPGTASFPIPWPVVGSGARGVSSVCHKDCPCCHQRPPQPGWVTISRARIFPIQPGSGEGCSGPWIAFWGGGDPQTVGRMPRFGKRDFHGHFPKRHQIQMSWFTFAPSYCSQCVPQLNLCQRPQGGHCPCRSPVYPDLAPGGFV